MSVADYVAGSALVEKTVDRNREVVPRGSLSVDRLADVSRGHIGGQLSLQHVDEPLGRAPYRKWARRPDRVSFRASCRFAVVGLLARLIDVGLKITLLFRGRVPRGFTAAAERACAQAPDRDRCYYYGRVSEDEGYLALQYWYLYAMNDWRSSFGGINDHEGDWEQVTIFLVDHGEGPRPAWVAFSSHDEVGDELRRRWDDPDIEWVGDHPVVYVGAGSHSGAYLRGEYLVDASVSLPDWVSSLRRVWNALQPWRRSDDASVLNISYIDYRRGDAVHRVERMPEPGEPPPLRPVVQPCGHSRSLVVGG